MKPGQEESDCQTLGVDRGGGEIGLYPDVVETASDGTGKPMPGLGFTLVAFDADAVTAVEGCFVAAPPGVFSAGPQRGVVVLVPQDGAPLRGCA